MIPLTAIFLTLLTTQAALANEPTTSAAPGDRIRCEQARKLTLVELKEKLVSNCNLDKPFSFTSTDPLQSAFIYCCHKKG